jgi:hypothetical protein
MSAFGGKADISHRPKLGFEKGSVMSALGQKQTSYCRPLMSALPPKADNGTQSRIVRFVPKADSCTAAIGGGNGNVHAASTCRSTITGSVKVKVEPWPSCDSTQIFPPCISMMRLDMASPKPVPPFLRVMALSAC